MREKRLVRIVFNIGSKHYYSSPLVYFCKKNLKLCNKAGKLKTAVKEEKTKCLIYQRSLATFFT